jgi:ribosomal protein L35
MGKTQTTKSFSKRIRITKNGKAIRRKMGVNHFKTRKNANGVRGKRNTLTLNMSAKRMSAFQ